MASLMVLSMVSQAYQQMLLPIKLGLKLLQIAAHHHRQALLLCMCNPADFCTMVAFFVFTLSATQLVSMHLDLYQVPWQKHSQKHEV